MDPPLRKRISWRTSMSTGVDVPASAASMARAAAALALGGAVVGALSLVLPHSASLDEGLVGALTWAPWSRASCCCSSTTGCPSGPST